MSRNTTSAARPIFVFAPGAGAPSTSEWMRAWASRLGALGDVEPFDYPYMKAGRKSPDRPPVLLAAHLDAVGRARVKYGDARPLVLAGKSMGSRVGCHAAVALAATGAPVTANVCFGYPLRAASSGAMRDEVLRALTTPVLFVQGTRDPLCDLAELATVRAQMTAPSQLFVVDGGDHSLRVGVKQLKTQGKRQEDWDAAVLDAVRTFLALPAA